ncbi:MAG: TRAP transporter large permease [Deltaproteobacteria bacterium]|nr:TRAP transporter large permease [Deltaproteobacteria bacterium]
MTIFLFIFFTLLLVTGLPIAFVLGMTSVIMLLFFSHTPLILIPEIMYNSLATFPLMAIPFFVIAAKFMVQGGTSKYLINAANSIVGSFSGGIAIVCVVSSMIFAAISGSSVATALSMGVIIIPAMMRLGYSRSFATGIVAASGTMGIMIPPSIALILYGIITDQSIPRLFLAGVLPGCLEGFLYIIWIIYYSKKKGYGGEERKSFGEMVKAVGKALPALSLPVIVLGGIYSGIVTVTEAAALAAVASIFISLVIYREIKPSQVIRLMGESMKSAGMIMFIIASAMVFGAWITQAGIPAQLVQLTQQYNLPWWAFLIVVNLLLLVLGMFLEVISIMLITLPIIYPVLGSLGIDPVHFAIVMTVNMEVALITPPVGLNLFVLSNVAKAPLSETIKGAAPFVILSLIELIIVTYWPSFSLFLPRLLMPGH